MKRIAVILLHVGYWAVYATLILLFDLVMSVRVHGTFVGRRFWWILWHNPAWIFLVVPAVGCFYLCYGVLFRLLLARRRFGRLAMAMAATIFAFSAIVIPLEAGITGASFGLSLDTFALVLFLSLVGLVNGILGLVLQGFITWVGEMRLKEELNRKNYEMELALIRSQLSPHFLFNTLNNIDVLMLKDAIRASGYLNKLSDLLRFILYEARASMVPLGKELAYIEKYIELQRIRISNPAAVRYTVEGEAGRMMVEPMLFLPFIENAFKHADKRDNDSVRIRFVLEEGHIHFECVNRTRRERQPLTGIAGGTVRPEARLEGSVGGLGNGLIRKRLTLLYPGSHTLEVQEGEDLYRAKLVLSPHAD